MRSCISQQDEEFRQKIDELQKQSAVKVKQLQESLRFGVVQHKLTYF